MYGQSDGMGIGRRTAHHYVFLCHERHETQTWFIGLFRKKLKKFKKKVNSTCKLEELCYNEKADTGKL